MPEGEWFCGDDCSGIRQTMSDLVVAGESACCGDPEYVWQVMRGRGGGGGGAGGGGGGGGEATNKALKLAQEVLQVRGAIGWCMAGALVQGRWEGHKQPAGTGG